MERNDYLTITQKMNGEWITVAVLPYTWDYHFDEATQEWVGSFGNFNDVMRRVHEHAARRPGQHRVGYDMWRYLEGKDEAINYGAMPEDYPQEDFLAYLGYFFATDERNAIVDGGEDDDPMTCPDHGVQCEMEQTGEMTFSKSVVRCPEGHTYHLI